MYFLEILQCSDTLVVDIRIVEVFFGKMCKVCSILRGKYLNSLSILWKIDK